MRVNSVTIDHYRSIEHISLSFPEKQPLVLFGPNNAGKSNILSALDRLLGDRYPTYIEMLDSDFYMRDCQQYPESNLSATFSEPINIDRYRGPQYTIAVRYAAGGGSSENLLHDGNNNKLYLTSEQRSKCQGYLIDAERNIQSAFNYGSKYSLLSKFSHRIHSALNTDQKTELTRAFEEIKAAFEHTAEYSSFFEKFSSALQGAVKGFVHSLAVDFSAYDPNNYAKSMRIFAKEGANIRGFEEFGTGEQQVMLMAFVKAYMQVFGSESIVLIIEEPEAHLHPLAQKWLKEYMVEMCTEGIQVVISTHSPDFIDVTYLSGLVRVFKEGGITRATQVSRDELCRFCIDSGAPIGRVTPRNVDDFYSTKLATDHIKGMFAETVILVEGATELYALPIYLKRIGFSLAEHGMEVINCGGKETIPLLWRLFKAYGFSCYIVFDADLKRQENDKLFAGILSIDGWQLSPNTFIIESDYAYFGKDFESFFASVLPDYRQWEQESCNLYGITSKPGKARVIAQHCRDIPVHITTLMEKLLAVELLN